MMPRAVSPSLSRRTSKNSKRRLINLAAGRLRFASFSDCLYGRRHVVNLAFTVGARPDRYRQQMFVPVFRSRAPIAHHAFADRHVGQLGAPRHIIENLRPAQKCCDPNISGEHRVNGFLQLPARHLAWTMSPCGAPRAVVRPRTVRPQGRFPGWHGPGLALRPVPQDTREAMTGAPSASSSNRSSDLHPSRSSTWQRRNLWASSASYNGANVETARAHPEAMPWRDIGTMADIDHVRDATLQSVGFDAFSTRDRSDRRPDFCDIGPRDDIPAATIGRRDGFLQHQAMAHVSDGHRRGTTIGLRAGPTPQPERRSPAGRFQLGRDVRTNARRAAGSLAGWARGHPPG